MDFEIDYGDVGASLGVKNFLMKKRRRIERLSKNAMRLNVDIRKEVVKGKDLPDSYAVDLEWTSRSGETHYATSKNRIFFKAASEAFDQMVRMINKSKKDYDHKNILDYLMVDSSKVQVSEAIGN